MTPVNFTDLMGKRYGRFVVVARAASIGSNTRWLCRCDCGAERTVQAGTLKRGASRSCGCAAVETKRPVRIVGDRALIDLTCGFVAIVDLADAELGVHNWCAHETHGGWYAVRRVRENGRSRNVYLHRVVAERAGQAIDLMDVDHKDGDRMNCRRDNLRPATPSQNGGNSKKPSTNTSGFKGAYWHRGGKKWAAHIKVNGRDHHLGFHLTKEAAAAAYAEAARRFHGEFARIR